MKLFKSPVIALSLVSIFAAFAEGSNNEENPKRRSSRVSATNNTNNNGTELHEPSDNELVDHTLETSRARNLRECASLVLPEPVGSNHESDEIYWKILDEGDKESSSDAPSNQENRKTRAAFDVRELKNQEYFTENFMSKIHKQYRLDLGLIPKFPDLKADEIDEVEVLAFFRSFDDTPERIFQGGPEFNLVIAEYAFLKSFDLLSGVQSYEEFKLIYDKKMTEYTFIDWNLIDLTRFRELNFPIFDKMVKEFIIEYDEKVYTTPLILSTFGANALKKFVNQIRFHDPHTIEGHQMLLFQRIYRRYIEAVHAFKSNLISSDDTDYINWAKWNVSTWPVGMSQSDLTSWTEDQILEMNSLIDKDRISFSMKNLLSKNVPENLRIPANHRHNSVERVTFNVKEISGSDSIQISDDEEYQGKEKKEKKNSRSALKKLESQRSRIAGLARDKNKMEVADQKREQRRLEKQENRVKKQQERREGQIEELRERSRNPKPLYKEVSTKSTSALKSSSSSDVIDIMDISTEPADPVERDRVLKRALKIFKEQTKSPNATVINWDLAIVKHLQNSILPFETTFDTTGHVNTLNNLMKHDSLKFLNLKNLKDRQIRAYQRIYPAYSKACDYLRDPFKIVFEDVEFEGLPNDLSPYLTKWTDEQIKEIERSYRENRIVARKTEAFEEEARVALAEYLKRNGGSTDSKSDSSSENVEIPLPVAATKMVSTYTTTPAKKKPKKTPNFSNMAINKVNSSAGVDEIVINEFEVNNNSGTSSSAVANSSSFNVQQLIEDIQNNIIQVITHRFDHDQSSRHYRIYTEILRALKLLHQHALHSLNPQSTPRPIIDVDEINGYLEVFHTALSLIDHHNGNLPVADMRNFIINRTFLRARLAGIGFAFDSLNNKKLKIKANQLREKDLCGYLTRSTNQWDLEVLEIMLDGEDDLTDPFFLSTTQNSNRK